MEFGPDFAKRARASSLVSPSGELLAVGTTAAGTARAGASVIKNGFDAAAEVRRLKLL
jgi:hypothetical protein